jgi:hypothetical protein
MPDVGTSSVLTSVCAPVRLFETKRQRLTIPKFSQNSEQKFLSEMIFINFGSVTATHY